MVVFHVKYKDENQFLYKTNLDSCIDDVVRQIAEIYNGRLKVQRICSEMEELSKYGTLYPPDILGLTPEQVQELKREDEWGEKCIPSGGFALVKDPMGRRNGKQPRKEMQEVLKKAIEEAKGKISKNLVEENEYLDQKIVQDVINTLKGAVMIVYPMKLPPHDCIRMEFENIEDLTGTQASLEVIDPATAQLWFCGKEMFRNEWKIVSNYVGKIDNCKVIAKLTKRGEGPPAREPIVTEEQRKEFMLQQFRRQEELRKLEEDDDDNYNNSQWANGNNLKLSFQGLNNITWRPGK